MAAPDLLSLLERRLATLARARPELSGALAVQAQLIRTTLTSARPPDAQPFALPREQLLTRVRAGVPALHEQPAQIDVQFAADLFSRIVELLQQREEDDLRARLAALDQAASRGLIDPQSLFAEAFVQHQDHLADIARQAHVDEYLLCTIAAESVAPLLRAYAARLIPLIEHLDDDAQGGGRWTYGYCPACGAWPLMGELRGVELALWLRCSACGSSWRSQRLLCPYCQNEDYRTQGNLTIEGEARFRIAVCERCHGYLKVCNAFDPPPAELLKLDDTATIHLDVAAIDRGYRRPGASGYRIELAVPDEEWVEELV